MDDVNIKKFMIPVVIILMAFLSFLIIKPLAASISIGLVLAYAFYHPYLKLKARVKSENLASLIIVGFVFIVVFLPTILLTPMFIKQMFQAYLSIKTTDFSALIINIFPGISTSPSFLTEFSSSISHFSASISNAMLALFQNTILNIPAIAFGIIIILFTFFFSLREGHYFREYFSTLIPFSEENTKKFLKKFTQVTNAVIYGQVVIGIVQGVLAGIAYYMFGIPNALILTVITLIVGILPVIGPWLVWIPLDIFLFISGNTVAGIQLLIFGIFVLNWIDVLLRPYVIASKADMNSAIALIGAIGGTYAFGIIGFILGPLLLAYFILLIEIYKNKKEESIVIREHKIP
jgi:predicted PurR-regulated permease PerM